ncbi:response regulator [Desulfovibrio inopinatus]|uniref:response regulator n=1 Tax=Desulfovibrio inopinatus TaxID=102109 RepID=UPI00041B4F73|nr:response regulator [Desulfovibrio inopinatus]
MSSESGRSANTSIVLVEDSPEDVRTVLYALKKAENTHSLQIHICGSANEALKLLEDTPSSQHLAFPALLLLDLNLPGKNGFELLQNIKGDSRLCHIPVIVFSGSDNEDDIQRSYTLGANSYIQKPSDMKRFVATVRGFLSYWLEFVRLPSRQN